MRNKKKIAFGAAALAVVMVAAGTYAWFSTTDKTKTNVFGMDNFDVTITEAFDTPEVPLVPGADITKEVGVTNSGNVPVVVRVKLEETLELLEQETGDGKDKLKVEYFPDKSQDNKYVPVLISQDMITAYQTNGYGEFSAGGYDKLSGITVLQKETKGNNGSSVYSYLAYVTEAFEGGTNHHLVQVTPKGDVPANPADFDVKYAYNVKKEVSPSTGTYKADAVHGKGDATLDKYYDSTNLNQFHDAVVLNFDTNVQTDHQPLKEKSTWYLADDGYFYYTEALKGTSISAPLLNSVSIKKEAGNTLKGAIYTITPVMEAVQLNYEAATATWTDMSGNKVTQLATVSENNAHQLVYNITTSENNKGYYSAP